MSTGQIAAVMGRGVVPGDTPIVSADDLGLVRGDGCFDATRVTRGSDGIVIDHLDAHLDRFDRSSELLGLPPLDRRAWLDLIDQATNAWTGSGEAVLKLVRSRGQEHGGGAPTEFCTVTALEDWQLRARGGIAVISVSRGYAAAAFEDAPWLLGGVKTLSYAVNAAAKRYAQSRGADDALFVSSDGFALEGTTSALIVRFDEVLVTTPTGSTGILPSVTQQATFAAAEAEGVRTEVRVLRAEDVARADGVWLASSIRGVCPVLTLDGQPVATDADWSVRLARYGGF